MARESFKASAADRGDKINLPASADDLPETVEVDLDNANPEDFTIVEEDDTPEEDRGRPTSYEPDPEMDNQVDDLRSLGKKKIEARIKRLSFERETERRAKEEAQRQLNAAIEAARMAQAEAEDMRRKVEMGGAALADSMLGRNEVAMREAKQSLKIAHANGDTENIAELQAYISKLAAEEIAIRQRMPTKPDPNQPQYQQQPYQQPYQQPQYQQPVQQAPQLAPNVAAWLGRNSWFGKQGNEAKTKFALSIHENLVARGVDPASPEYTRELDEGLKAVYKEHVPFNDDGDEDTGEEQRRPARRPNATAEGSRDGAVTAPTKSRTVTLTRSELSIAKRLGVSPQAYAAQKLKDMQRSGDGAN